MPNDAALSDMVGTMVLLAVTMLLLGAAAVAMDPADEVSTPRLVVTLGAGAGQDALTLTKTGGDAIDAADVRAVVTVAGALAYDGPVGPAGPWPVGDAHALPLAAPLTAGAHVAVELVWTPGGASLATAVVEVPRTATAPAAAPAMSVVVTFSNGLDHVDVDPGRALLVRANVVHADGRSLVRAVEADLSDFGGPAALALVDDGSGPDEVPMDGVYALEYVVPLSAHNSTKTVLVTAYGFDEAEATGYASSGVGTATDDGTVTVNPLPPGIPGPGGFSGDGADGGAGGDGSDGASGDPGGDEGPGDGEGYVPSTGDADDDDGFYLVYDRTVLTKVGIRVLKYPGGTSGDKVTVHVKTDLLDEPATFQGEQWTLQSVGFRWSVYKPGNQVPLSLAPWCNEPATHTKLFRVENATLPNYERHNDVVQYFLHLNWLQVGTSGNTAVYYTGTVDLSSPTQLIILKKSEGVRQILDEGWPASFASCGGGV